MAAHEFFDGMSKPEIKRMTESCIIRPIASEKYLFRKGDAGHEMFIILKGKIAIIDEYETHKKVIAELRPGELFGEMAMFEKEHTRSAHALSIVPSQVLVFSEDSLEKLLNKKMPRQFLINIVRIFCRRLRTSNNMYMRAKCGKRPVENIMWID